MSWNLFNTKEKHMAKKNTIKFSKSDAPKPKRLPSGFIGLRCPVPLTLKAGAIATINLNMMCDVALLVSGTRELKLVDGNQIVFPGQILSFSVVNPIGTNPHDVVVEIGQTVLTALPIFNTEFEIE